ncbi:YhbD family protein [Paenibacillus sp.]|jgi:DNA-binding transcriptional MerR regulator|uniref:YhbD family protein n=1 Tax=Paenibacillus sp. TaxID=58172 RepID=UPI002826737B|nr:YhbD family protein [Paenibacillus sp.]MDR0267682.1 YhbD family protein [Paenibacillus sp.]
MNEEDLISKKELLEMTGISYGQLYRWKRKNLIPEEWFIRRSSFTGQETFFPQIKILQRVERIKNMKDGLSLDELADVFSPSSNMQSMSTSKLLQHNIVASLPMGLFEEVLGSQEALSFNDILTVYVLHKLFGEITREEGKMLIAVMRDHYGALAAKPCELVLIRKMGVPLLFLAESAEQIYFDKNVKWIFRLSLAAAIEELKMKLNEMEA